MRQPVKQVCHTAALVVNDEKADIIRAEVQSQGQHISLKGLGFSGSCSSCYQAVRSVIFLMDIQITHLSSGLYPHLSLHVLIVPVLSPPLLSL